MPSFTQTGFRFLGLVSAMIFGMAASTAVPAAEPGIYAGESVQVGNGAARVVVATDSAGLPTSVSVVLSAAVLEGLPGHHSGRETWEYVLPMPAGAPRTGYDHVGLNWNPEGHVPDGIYSVPHFDVHFYLISRTERDAVTFHGTAATAALAPPDGTLVPEGYAVPPDSAVEKMGLHGVDTRSHEFHGKPFDHTFLYGYYNGRLIFLEPMVTLDYLKTRPRMTAAVRVPRAYSLAAYYPARYRIAFDAGREEYMLSLLALKPFSPGKQAVQR